MLQGIEPVQDTQSAGNVKPDARLFVVIATAFHLIGLVISAMIWYEEQTTVATAVGLILLVIGCMIYGIGMTISAPETRKQAKRKFWSVNIWTLTFIPLSILYNILSGYRVVAPYPVPVRPLIGVLLFWVAYLGIGVGVNLAIGKNCD